MKKFSAFFMVGAMPHGVGVFGLVEDEIRVAFAVARRGEIFGWNFAKIEIHRGQQLLDVVGRCQRCAVERDFKIELAVLVAWLDFQRGRRFGGGLRISCAWPGVPLAVRPA
ncbi:MAG: hypothetical protein MZW92_35590 [Comamonadaceae bacterium]|nr:hypothetical protein [Comamonadaceae bacterium]